MNDEITDRKRSGQISTRFYEEVLGLEVVQAPGLAVLVRTPTLTPALRAHTGACDRHQQRHRHQHTPACDGSLGALISCAREIARSPPRTASLPDLR